MRCTNELIVYMLSFVQDLKEHQKTKEAEFARTKASVFHTLSIVELSILIILNVWDRIADHYVDYTGMKLADLSLFFYHIYCNFADVMVISRTGKMTREEIIDMLRTRARRKEVSYATYNAYLANPTPEVRKELAASATAAAAAAYAAEKAKSVDRTSSGSPKSVATH